MKDPANTGWRDDPDTRPDTIARLEKVLELLAIHGFIETACRQAHSSKETFYTFKNRYPDFAEEAEQASSQARTELEATGWASARKAINDPRYLPMLIFALKAKADWKESHHLDVTSGGKSVDPLDMNDEEIYARIEEYLGRSPGHDES